MKTANVYLTGAAVLALLLFGVYYFNQKPSQINSPQPISNSAQPKKTDLSSQVSYNCQAGKTAFEVLQDKNQVQFQGSSFGRMITAINGKNQGQGKYWLYFIDGKEASVSADAYLCQGNEQIKWELK
ncbi:DUF4430 domain-containing protein [Candidatus Daviesbacteria bacterium]|nr:DUF4430 domain-containing protein [Candidatus Daviesbacteria bacterium]